MTAFNKLLKILLFFLTELSRYVGIQMWVKQVQMLSGWVIICFNAMQARVSFIWPNGEQNPRPPVLVSVCRKNSDLLRVINKYAKKKQKKTQQWIILHLMQLAPN